MSLPTGPLHTFSRWTVAEGRVTVEIRLPWTLTWAIEPLGAFLAWELAGAAEAFEQASPRYTRTLLETRAGTHVTADLLDRHSTGRDRFVRSVADDLERIYPRPLVVIHGTGDDDAGYQALADLDRIIDAEIQCPTAPSSDAEATLAAALFGAFGFVNEPLAEFIIQAAQGDRGLVDALERLWRERAGAYPAGVPFDYIVASDQRLIDVRSVIRHRSLPHEAPDWLGIRAADLVHAIWCDSSRALDELRRSQSRELRGAPNCAHVRVCIARHALRYLRGHRDDARVDLLEATVHLRQNRPTTAWRLLEPYTHRDGETADCRTSAHIFGQAGRAVGMLGDGAKALELYERNLELLPGAFGTASFGYKKALASLQHKIAQLVREYPELPGGLTRARTAAEESLRLHDELDIQPGVSMCLSELSEIALASGDTDAARTWLVEALEADRRGGNVNGQCRVLHQLASLEEERGDFESARTYVEECEKLLPAHQLPEIARQLRNSRIRIEARLGRRQDDAAEILEDVCWSDNPRTVVTDVQRQVSILRERGDIGEAERRLRATLERQLPHFYANQIRLTLIGVLLDLRRHAEARTLLGEMRDLVGWAKDEYALNLARVEAQEQRFAAAEEILASLESGAPARIRARVFMLRGRMLLNQERWEAAVDAFAQAEALGTGRYPRSLTQEFRCRALVQAGRFDDALSVGRQMLDVATESGWMTRRVRALALIGDALMGNGEFNAAAQHYELALHDRTGSDALAHVSRASLERRAALACSAAGKGDLALAHINHALERFDEDGASADQGGWLCLSAASVFRRYGRLAEFEDALRRAQECAAACDDPRLRSGVQTLRFGEELAGGAHLVETDSGESDSVQLVLARARWLRKQGQLQQALETIRGAESAVMSQGRSDELLEVRLAVSLDAVEKGQPLPAEHPEPAVLLERLLRGRTHAEVSGKIQILAARHELLRCNYPEAERLAGLAYAQASSSREFFTLARVGSVLSSTMTATGRAVQAIAMLLEIAAFMAHHHRFQLAFNAKYSAARLLIGERGFDDATRHLDELLAPEFEDRLSNWVQIQIARAEILRVRNQSAAALDTLAEVIARVQAEGQPQLAAEPRRMESAILLDRGEFSASAASLSDTHHHRSGLKRTNAAIKHFRANGNHEEALALAERELERTAPAVSTKRAIALHNAALANFKQKNFPRAEELVRDSLAQHIALRMLQWIPGVRGTLARILLETGRREEGERELRLALIENQANGDARGISICERMLARLEGRTPTITSDTPFGAKDLLIEAMGLRRSGQARHANVLVAEALDRARAEGDRLTEARALGALGLTRFHARELPPAISFLEQALELHEQLGSSGIGECGRVLGHAYLLQRRDKEAEAIFKRILRRNLPCQERAAIHKLMPHLDLTGGGAEQQSERSI